MLVPALSATLLSVSAVSARPAALVRPSLASATPLARPRTAGGLMAFTVDNPIAVGDKLPDAEVEVVNEVAMRGAGDIGTTASLASVLGNGKAVLLGMPGAFTPTCNDVHLPGFYQKAADFQRAGVSCIALVTTNDRFVNAEWQRSMELCQGVPEGQSPIVMLSDARGDLAESLGLIGYLGRAMGVRSKRFALVVEDGVVVYKAVDEGAETMTSTSADAVYDFVAAPKAGGEALDLLLPLAAGAGGLLLLLLLLSQLF